MSANFEDTRPIEGKDDLVGALSAGEKPETDWRIGTEHEKFGFRTADNGPLPYDAPDGEPSVRAMLEGMTRFGWERVQENGQTIALKKDCGGSISLEPGGQFELSGAPLDNVHQTCAEVNRHLREVREVADEIGAGFLGLGFSPKWSLEQTPLMPKSRYKIMKAYMPRVGGLGHQMMFRSATVQVNLDFSDEADMAKKFRVSLALQPIATALFANSPFKDGGLSGFMSYRAHVWTDTDQRRTGTLPFVFDEGFGYEHYVDWALDAPMYFITRGGQLIDASGESFRGFLDGKLPQLPGETPNMGDWETHLSTLFPEVRLKSFLEMRGADSGPWGRLCALPAFWAGILYDAHSLDAAWELVKDWSPEERECMRASAARYALKAPFRTETLQDLAKRALEIARAGLNKRARLNHHGENEALFLDELDAIAESGRSPARALLAKFEGEWGQSIEPVFKELAY